MAKAILDKILGTLLASVAVIAAVPQEVNAQGFDGSFAPDQWELFNSSPVLSDNSDNSEVTIGGIPLAPFNGSADFTNAPDSLTLLGSNQSQILDEFGLDCQSVDPSFLFLCGTSFTTVFVTVPEDSILSFNWDYTTAARATTGPSGPAFDPFGFALGNFPPTDPRTDGSFTELIDRDGPFEQTGSASVEVSANQIFGFQIGTADNQGGRATATISQFQVRRVSDPTAVPEPASGLAIAAVAGLGWHFTKKSSHKK